MDTCTSLIMHETIVFLPFDGILMRNTSFRAKRASELRAMYDPREGAVCSLDAIERCGRAPFRQVSSFPCHRFRLFADRPRGKIIKAWRRNFNQRFARAQRAKKNNQSARRKIIKA